MVFILFVILHMIMLWGNIVFRLTALMCFLTLIVL